MKIFKLPDLGEGLPDAIIREWHVVEGDSVDVDQTIVSMETAKALVEVPAPFAGVIAKRFGLEGDVVDTGQALIGFEGEATEEDTADSGTVVGAIEKSDHVLQHPNVASPQVATGNRPRATPAVRALARQLGIDLATIQAAGPRIQAEDVRRAAAQSQPSTANATEPTGSEATSHLLSPVRRAMAHSMAQSHASVVPVTLSDEVDISAWKGKDNITIRIIRAMQAACLAEPILNAYFNDVEMRYTLHDTINLGLAIDTPDGLFVPVLRDIAQHTDASLRQHIDALKSQAQSKSLPPEALKDPTIILSNFGTIAGKTANPVLLPPMTAIVGIGRLYDGVHATDGQLTIKPTLPISITVDHRAVTGGELARFLKAMIDALLQPPK